MPLKGPVFLFTFFPDLLTLFSWNQDLLLFFFLRWKCQVTYIVVLDQRLNVDNWKGSANYDHCIGNKLYPWKYTDAPWDKPAHRVSLMWHSLVGIVAWCVGFLSTREGLHSWATNKKRKSKNHEVHRQVAWLFCEIQPKWYPMLFSCLLHFQSLTLLDVKLILFCGKQIFQLLPVSYSKFSAL